MDGKLLEMVLEDKPEDMPEKPKGDPVLYQKTRTVRAGNLVEVECYPVYVGSYRRAIEKATPTSKAQKEVNDRNARKRFERLAEENFRTGIDYALSLTYDEAPDDQKTCDRHLRNYLARVNRARKKAGLPKAKCIGVIEYGKKGRLHHHLLIEGGLPRDKMEELWGHGIANCDRIQRRKGGIVGLKIYFTKGFSGKRETGRHRYFYTRNLKNPKITESKTKVSKRMAERIREDTAIEGEEIIRKKYPGMILEGITVRTSDWMPGVYIYARLRR